MERKFAESYTVLKFYRRYFAFVISNSRSVMSLGLNLIVANYFSQIIDVVFKCQYKSDFPLGRAQCTGECNALYRVMSARALFLTPDPRTPSSCVASDWHVPMKVIP
jgi:hypothetical protein